MIKIVEKKPKGALRKMNSLREDSSNKYETNWNYFKNLPSNNSEMELN